MVTGPAFGTVLVPTATPSTESVNWLALPLAPVTHMTTHTVPPTVPPVGCVPASVSEPGDGGGVAVLDTVTVLVAVAVRPAPSVTVAVSVCWAFVAVLVFHE